MTHVIRDVPVLQIGWGGLGGRQVATQEGAAPGQGASGHASSSHSHGISCETRFS
jgi:hypothetical protein